jgi:hypothetical protein
VSGQRCDSSSRLARHRAIRQSVLGGSRHASAAQQKTPSFDSTGIGGVYTLTGAIQSP